MNLDTRHSNQEASGVKLSVLAILALFGAFLCVSCGKANEAEANYERAVNCAKNSGGTDTECYLCMIAHGFDTEAADSFSPASESDKVYALNNCPAVNVLKLFVDDRGLTSVVFVERGDTVALDYLTETEFENLLNQ